VDRRIDYKLKFYFLTDQNNSFTFTTHTRHCNNRSNALINGLTVIDSLNETL